MKKIILATLRIFRQISSLWQHSTLHGLLEALKNYWRKTQLPKAAKSCRISKDCYIIGGGNIYIGKETLIEKGNILTVWEKRKVTDNPTITIGEYCDIGQFCHITCVNKIVIGNNVLTGRWVTITDNSHGEFNKEQLPLAPKKRPVVSKGPVIIEDDVWIGDKVTILPGVKIGKGSIIGANAVVTKDIPQYCMAVGNPAKVIKQIK